MGSRGEGTHPHRFVLNVAGWSHRKTKPPSRSGFYTESDDGFGSVGGVADAWPWFLGAGGWSFGDEG